MASREKPALCSQLIYITCLKLLALLCLSTHSLLSGIWVSKPTAQRIWKCCKLAWLTPRLDKDVSADLRRAPVLPPLLGHSTVQQTMLARIAWSLLGCACAEAYFGPRCWSIADRAIAHLHNEDCLWARCCPACLQHAHADTRAMSELRVPFCLAMPVGMLTGSQIILYPGPWFPSHLSCPGCLCLHWLCQARPCKAWGSHGS